MSRKNKHNRLLTGRYGRLGDLISRLRHRHGFGVHSPFGFDLIKNAMYLSPRYRFYGESDIDMFPISGRRKKRLRILLRIIAYMGIGKVMIPSDADEALRETLKLAGAGFDSSIEDKETGMIVDFDGNLPIEDATKFLNAPWRCVWQKLPATPDIGMLPGQLVMLLKDSYIAFSRPGMARTVYKV